ncbi:MAG TPA: hypothetical protein VGO07_02145 [Candidatus Saccharimonadales bacterium]|jgi:hypothetical protein|nr:hypothetical protein [Candidatus Saccharimonadales bacterium]
MGSHSAKRGASAAARGFGGPELRAKTAATKPALDELVNEAPAGGHAATEAGAGGRRERRRTHKIVRTVVGLGTTALAIAGAATLIFGGNDGSKVETGPALLETGTPTPPKGDALLEQARGTVQRNVNNGENGNTVHILLGTVTTETPDGQKVTFADPIVSWEGLPAQAAQQLEAGKFDTSILDGRLFSLKPGSDKTTPGNFDHGVEAIPITGTTTYTPLGGGPKIVDQAINWESADNVAVDHSGAPLEVNVQTDQVAQHKVGGAWHELAVGQQVPTPHA